MKEVTQPGFPETDDILHGNWGGGSFPKGDQILLGSIKGDSSYSPYNGSLNVPLCTPYILAGIVFEIDKGTRVLTHSPNAIHKRRQYRRYRPLPVCTCASGPPPQCN